MTATTTNGLVIPVHDTRNYTFVGFGSLDNDKVLTITYFFNGNQVALRTFTYVGSTNNILTDVIEQTATNSL